MSENSPNDYKEKQIVMVFCEEYGKEMEAEIVDFRNGRTEVYIHFLRQDKRLDRWVDVSCLSKYDETQRQEKDDRILSRNQRKMLDNSEDNESLPQNYQQFERLHKEVTKIRNIDRITIGNYTIKTWYFSPYPFPFFKMDHIYVCEQCFHYFGSLEELNAHQAEARELCPPGREIYRDGNISIFELKGWRQKLSCQCLCLLSKLFLDHKALFYDVEGFVFYVLCETDEKGAHIAAYFSRELNSFENNVLACITTLPPYQKKGYGHMLISLSYEIAKRLKRSGGPERPLSDLGKIAFTSFWREVIAELVSIRGFEIRSVDDIVALTAIAKDDAIEALTSLGLVQKVKGQYDLIFSKESITSALSAFEGKNKKRVNPALLIWLPGDDDR